MSALALLGEKIFADPSLSASGTLSCQTCHSPDHALASPVNEAVPIAGAALDVPGFRNAPSLRYVAKTPPFSIDSDGAPAGGFDRDGRANTLAEQARRPFLAEHEMANETVTDVSDKLSQRNLRRRLHRHVRRRHLRSTGGRIRARAHRDRAVRNRRPGLRAVRQQVRCVPRRQEPNSAPRNYAASHCSTIRRKATAPRVIRAAAAPAANRRCSRTSATTTSACRATQTFPRTTIRRISTSDCAAPSATISRPRAICAARFKVPTLRNIALTAPYFHNGRFATLTEALGFYVRRDTNPEEWYPIDSGGQVHKFDDLPPQYVANVNTTEVPYNRKAGRCSRH